MLNKYLSKFTRKNPVRQMKHNECCVYTSWQTSVAFERWSLSERERKRTEEKTHVQPIFVYFILLFS